MSLAIRAGCTCLVASILIFISSDIGFCKGKFPTTVRTGVAYDYFSQKYFFDSLISSGTDTSLTTWEYSRRYLNDSRLWFSANQSLSNSQENRLHCLGELSNEQWRFRLASLFSLPVKKNKLSGGMEVERRNRYRGISESGDSYWLVRGQSKLHVPLFGRWKTLARLTGDWARFDSTTTSAMNYYRYSGSSGLELDFGDVSLASIDLFDETRRVPDSVWLGYTSYGADAFLFWGHGRGDLNASVRVEKRAYKDPDGIDNHTRWDAYIRSKTKLSPRWFVFADVDGEAALFDDNNFLNQSLGKIRMAALFGLSLGESSDLAVGLSLELLSEKDGLITVTPDYTERGIRIDADILAGGDLVSSLQSVTGVRDIYQESDTDSDSRFQRLTAVGDGRIIGRLRVSFTWSVEWEWHDRKSDNSASQFLSASLSQSF